MKEIAYIVIFTIVFFLLVIVALYVSGFLLILTWFGLKKRFISGKTIESEPPISAEPESSIPVESESPVPMESVPSATSPFKSLFNNNIWGRTRKVRCFLLVILLFFPIRFGSKYLITLQTEFFRDANKSIKYLQNSNNVSIEVPYRMYLNFLDEKTFFYFTDKEIISIGEKKECNSSFGNKKDIDVKAILKKADCLYKEKKYREEYELLKFIVDNRLNNVFDEYYYKDYISYIRYIERHYLKPATTLLEDENFLLWSRRLFVMAKNRISFMDFPPLDYSDNYVNDIFNKVILVNWFIQDTYDYYFNNENVLGFLRSIDDIKKLSYIKYEELNDFQKECYKYLVGVRYFREKKYDLCYSYFDKNGIDESNIGKKNFKDINDYITLMKVRCIFWDIYYRKFRLIGKDEFQNNKSEVIEFVENMKDFIYKDSVKNDIDYYIEKIGNI